MHWDLDACILNLVDAPACIGARQTAGALYVVVRASNGSHGPPLGTTHATRSPCNTLYKDMK